jgi:hypothetical protein
MKSNEEMRGSDCGIRNGAETKSMVPSERLGAGKSEADRTEATEPKKNEIRENYEK